MVSGLVQYETIYNALEWIYLSKDQWDYNKDITLAHSYLHKYNTQPHTSGN